MKGIYILVVELNQSVDVPVGSLGKIRFPKGYYFYVGSAQNSLEARIQRHLCRDKRHHWHIDYFLNFGRVVKVLVYPGFDKSWESRIANLLAKRYKPVPGFGCTDTDDISHLFLLKG
jgi:Uri superfamily endonuclease